MSSPPRKAWTKRRVSDARSRLEADSVDPSSPSQRLPHTRFHEAAALLSWFEINRSLNPTGRDVEKDNAALAQLIQDSICIEDDGPIQRWTLKNDVRKMVLESLGEQERFVAALSANPDRPKDHVQVILEECIKDQAASVESQDLDELSATLQVLDWLPSSFKGSAQSLPRIEDVRARIELLTLQAPFRALANQHFKGRKKELATLRDYVGIREASSALVWAKRGLRNVLNLREKPPLVIHGPGGMGKSTLLAQFILEHTAGNGPRLPFVYLDCDRPGLVPEEPLTLLLEAVRQLGIQNPTFTKSSKEWVKQWQRELLRRSEATDPNDALTKTTQYRQRFLESCGAFIEDLNLGDAPVLFVIDTFEEVQYRGEAYVQELWRFLGEFQALAPRLRTVIAGRAMVRNLPAEPLLLDSLDMDAAAAYLAVQGVEDAQLARVVARQMRGNPLSLKLAAQVLRLESADGKGVQSLDAIEGVRKRVDDTRIQGELHRRILSHIARDDVRKLAHPGLVLRRITPELIFEVLASPCGVAVSTMAQSEQLFNALRREVSLVTTASGNDREVRHRPDIRRVMLDLLRKSDAGRVAEIETAAVAFYMRSGEELSARAEEIYHRLGLGQDAETISGRWLPGVDEYLRSAIEDFSGPAQAILASRLGIESLSLRLDDQPDEAWEAIAGKQVDDLLQLSRPEDALALLRSRSFRSKRSPLQVLEARALSQLGRAREARQVTRFAIAEYGDEVVPDVLDLELVQARADEILGDSTATGLAARYIHLDAVLEKDVRLLALGVSWARMLSDSRPSEDPEISTIRRLLATTVEFVSDSALRENPELLRQIVAHRLLERKDQVERLATLVATIDAQSEQHVDSSQEASTVQVALPLTSADLNRLGDALSAVFSLSELDILVADALKTRLFEVVSKGPLRSVVWELISWAEREGKTTKLVETALRRSPENIALRSIDRFKSTIPYSFPRARPTEALLLDGGAPFIGRTTLRKFLSQIDEPVQSRVLVVSGDRGSGKSYSTRLIRFVAERSGRFDVAVASATVQTTPHELIRALAIRAGWNPDAMPSASNGSMFTPQEGFAELSDWTLAQSSLRRRTIILVVDDLDRSTEAFTVFVVGLANKLQGSANATMRLILLGLAAARPPAQVETEHVSLPTRVDLLSFFQVLGEHQPAAGETSKQVEVAVRMVAESGEDTYAHLNSYLHTAAFELLRAPTLVRAMSSAGYASQPPRIAKLVLTIGGYGGEKSEDLLELVATQFSQRSSSYVRIPTERVGNGDFRLKRLDAGYGNPLSAIAFASVYWDDIPEAVTKRKDAVEEVKTGMSSLVRRAEDLYFSSVACGKLRKEDFSFISSVVDETVETIHLLENFFGIAKKLGGAELALLSQLSDYFVGARIATDFPYYRQKILHRFHRALAQAVTTFQEVYPGCDPEIHIVAHSEGTVISFLGLLEALSGRTVVDPDNQARTPVDAGWIRYVRGYMTIGSPIDKHIVMWPALWRGLDIKSSTAEGQVLFGDAKAPRLTLTHKIKWRNYYDLCDPIGSKLDSAVRFLKDEDCEAFEIGGEHDYGFSRQWLPGNAHNDYWNDPEVFGHFIDDVVLPIPVGKSIVPGSSWLVDRVSVAIPYVASLLLHVAAVSLLYKGVTQSGSNFDRLTLQILLMSGLLMGITSAARLPRLVHTGGLRWHLASLVAFTAGAWPFFHWLPPGPADFLGEPLTRLFSVSAADSAFAGRLAPVIAAAVVALSGWLLPRKPKWGRRCLIGVGILVIAFILSSRLLGVDTSPDQPVWPVLLAGAAFLYLWWLGILIFDLSFIWHRYIRRSVVEDTLRQWKRGHDARPNPKMGLGAPDSPASSPAV